MTKKPATRSALPASEGELEQGITVQAEHNTSEQGQAADAENGDGSQKSAEEGDFGGGGSGDNGNDGTDGGGFGNGSPPDGSEGRPFTVRLDRSREDPRVRTEVALWTLIEQSTERLSFRRYADFLDKLLTPKGHGLLWLGVPEREPRYKRDAQFARPYSVYGSDAYDLLRGATTVFMMHEAGTLNDLEWLLRDAERFDHEGDREAAHIIRRDEEVIKRRYPILELNNIKREYEGLLVEDGQVRKEIRTLPYLALIREKLSELRIKDGLNLGTCPDQYGILSGRLDPVMIELIWSYWYEQGMLVQTMNAIALRFQNKRSADLADALLTLALDPLRPLSNLFWGWIQDEGSRLTIARRAYEYDQQYGLTLSGKAVPELKSVDRRSKFIECFHNLLHECIGFFKERDNLTVKADGFPLLNSIKDLHLLLATGANNQFADLTWVARQEMMIMQWLLARPEFREFLGNRLMVPYQEPWMDRVDTMRMLQRWGDASITSFYYLARFGERILLSLRYGNWSEIIDPHTAAGWADRWRSEIQT
jgi:hypothetical protein